jgi:hypothetical protein
MKPKRLKAKCYQHPCKGAVRKIRTVWLCQACVLELGQLNHPIRPGRAR